VRHVCLILTALVSLVPAYSQVTSFRGEIECESCSSYATLSVELSDAGKNISSTAAVSVSGSVDFQGIPEGSYMLTVKDFRGNPIYQQAVSVRPNSGPVSIRLPEQKGERPVSGFVSVSRLKHKIPKQARKAFEKSVQLSEKGDDEAALNYLKKATEIDPEYMEAFNNLGARYMKLGEHQQALTAFRRAMELDPSATLVQINTGAALMAVGDMSEAELTLRRVVESSGNIKARYMLGLALYSQRKYTPETLDLFRRCQDDYPSARLAIAVIHANLGHADEARQVLKSYISTAPESGRREAQALLAGLQQHGN
jgi:tetratricopeptide (TPR) repeat protein